jgi:hypothetical protein
MGSWLAQASVQHETGFCIQSNGKRLVVKHPRLKAPGLDGFQRLSIPALQESR